MSAKKLDQSVFDGLLSEYRWAAVSRYRGGSAHVFPAEPSSRVEFGDWTFWSDRMSICVGSDFDASDWQNSLIERQDVPTAADIDWSRQDVPAGATHYIPESDEYLPRYFKDDFSKVWVVNDYHEGNQWVDFPSNRASEIDFSAVLAVPTKPEPQVDWSKAPEGATHYNTSSDAFFKRLDSGLVQVFAKTAGEWASLGAYTVFDLESSTCTIKRPESITEIPYSVKAARVAEKSMPYPDGDARYFETSLVGQKHDASKPRYSLLPAGSVDRVIDVLELGATKYAPNNWQHVSDARTRYYDATMRHLSTWWQGETHDAESGLHHLAHAACCILFLLWFERGAK